MSNLTNLEKIKKLYLALSKSIKSALDQKSNLTSSDFHNWQGMSGLTHRHFLNNLCNNPDINYLEIGLWKGSTFCSALYENQIKAVGIDNWSEFGGPKEDFLKVLDTVKGKNIITVYDNDCFQVDVQELVKRHGKFNVYFYDGGHSFQEQELAFTHFNDCLDDVFIAIIDDLRQPEVREGTRQAFYKLDYDVIREFDMVDCFNGEDDLAAACGWFNGVKIALVSKDKNLMLSDRSSVWKLFK